MLPRWQIFSPQIDVWVLAYRRFEIISQDCFIAAIYSGFNREYFSLSKTTVNNNAAYNKSLDVEVTTATFSPCLGDKLQQTGQQF